MPITATFVVKDNATPTPQPVAGVKVRIYNASDIFQFELTTNASGQAQQDLTGSASPGTLYFVRLIPPVGYTIPQAGGTYTVMVIDPLGMGQTNIFDFTVIPPPAVPVSLNPSLCRLSGTFVDSSLRPVKNMTLVFHPRQGHPTYVISGLPFSGEPTIIDGKIVASERSAKTDANGYVELELPRKGEFQVYVQGIDAADHTLLSSVYIPDAAGAKIEDVLFPYVSKVTYASASINVAVGASIEVDVTPEASNLQPIDSQLIMNTFLEFKAADSTKALVEVTVDGKLRITGLAAGTTTLTVVRREGTVATRRPTIASIVIVPSVPAITVT